MTWTHEEASAIAAVEYGRFVDVVAILEPDDWGRPTDCEGWDVRAVAAHQLGSMRSAASPVAAVRQAVAARRRGRSETFVDALSAVQVESAADLSPHELVAGLEAMAPRAGTGRRRIPRPVRAVVRVPVELPAIKETWRFGFLVDVILTRDTWMHRIDICRAVGRQPVLTPDHDGRIVADVVHEWARRHGRPFELVLDGPAGGTFAVGGGGPHHRLDAVEFCRIVSGRAPGAGLLSQEVAF